jgi:hypothetical protein
VFRSYQQPQHKETKHFSAIASMSRRAANWKRLQEQTFTKWFNNVLRADRSRVQIENLETDLKDGLILVQLLESLSKERMTGVHRKPNFEQHKIENLNACFRFMEKANIKLVNIGEIRKL